MYEKEMTTEKSTNIQRKTLARSEKPSVFKNSGKLVVTV